MKITKYDHACLVLEERGKRIVVDPGSFVQTSLGDLKNVAGVIITHVHADHFDEDHLDTLLKNNPEAQIFSTQEVADKYTKAKVNVVSGGSEAGAGPFKLQFFGGDHAVIHPSFPRNQNVGVLINNLLYYPGDSFTTPNVPVRLLALPVSAPWLKLSESMDFVASVKPKTIFPTHNALNSPIAEGIAENMVGGFAKNQGADYKFVPVGESIEV